MNGKREREEEKSRRREATRRRIKENDRANICMRALYLHYYSDYS